jgi:hypothetical protein
MLRVSIPGADRDRTDACNILPFVMEMTENYLQRLGTNDRILKQLHAVSKFSTCKTNRLNMGKVQGDRTLTALQQFIRTGQVFVEYHFKFKYQSKKRSRVKN